jgi:hypothetical protein
MLRSITVSLLAGAALVGCATDPSDARFGTTVGPLMQAQIANPAASEAASDKPVTGMNGKTANNVADQLFRDVALRGAQAQSSGAAVGGETPAGDGQ